MSAPHHPGVTGRPVQRCLAAGRAALLAALLAAALPAAPVSAAGGASSADEAAAMVRAQTGGQILGVKSQGGRYLVKVLTGNGRVRVVAVPAR